MQTVAPFFSIIIPTFNRCAFVKEAISSCFSQTFTDYEIIVIDDGSTDATREHLSTNFSNNIHYHFQENSGAEEARNRGIALAKGTYLVFLDSDDMLLPDALRTYYQLLQATSAAIIISKSMQSHHVPVHHIGKQPDTAIHYFVFKDYLAKECPVWLSTSFIIIKKQLLSDTVVTFTKGTFPVDDLDFLLRAGTFSPCVIVTSPATVFYRYHGSNSVSNISSNLDKLTYILHLERSGYYPGGKKRAFDRLSIIGGHLQSWCLTGIRAGHLLKSAKLLLLGIDALLAIIIKKSLRTIRKQCTSPQIT